MEPVTNINDSSITKVKDNKMTNEYSIWDDHDGLWEAVTTAESQEIPFEERIICIGKAIVYALVSIADIINTKNNTSE